MSEGVGVFPGLDEALIGYGQQWSRPMLAVYSQRKIVEALEGQGMNREEALDWFSFNIECAWYGEQTPIILKDLP